MLQPGPEPKELLRIIDASFDRAAEGLRVLEDVARLLLNDAQLTGRLKSIRHSILKETSILNLRLLDARDAGGDVGAATEETGRGALQEVITANARRAQESLRTLEELAKLPGIPLDAEKFKQARFELYIIERELMSRLLRQESARRISGLYVIVDTQLLRGRSHLEVARAAIEGGARVIQLRDKAASKKILLPVAQQLQELCTASRTVFIMNDYLDLALAVGADGVHLGQDDIPVHIARKLMPIDKIIGCSVNDIDKAVAAESDGADYIAVASLYPTTSKNGVEVVGPGLLREIKERVKIPIVAIGGITKDNVAEVMDAGADAAAVISAVLTADNIKEAAEQIIQRFEVRK